MSNKDHDHTDRQRHCTPTHGDEDTPIYDNNEAQKIKQDECQFAKMPRRRYPLIDTHTHFDAPVFDHDRQAQTARACQNGVWHLVLVGYVRRHFERLYRVQTQINTGTQSDHALQAHIALGLHPFYIDQHSTDDLSLMRQRLDKGGVLAIGEIGLDTFTDEMKTPEMIAKQKRFFEAQLDMATEYQLPVMLHIRKAHADALAILKAHDYDARTLGGIAHSFSGGEQEAKAFVKLGFKLGVTGQVSNPNAKKLRRAITAAVDAFGIECLVIETDCPDMTPIMCQSKNNEGNNASALGQSVDNEWQGADGHDRNVPANLPWVLDSLSELLGVDKTKLAEQLWQNSIEALQVSWPYPQDKEYRTTAERE